MLINEAGMVRAIKDAYKRRGYTAYNHGEAVSIFCEDWCVKCEWGILPRKVLAIIVEHMGTIPTRDEPLFIEKGEEPQMAFCGSVMEELDSWYEGPPEQEAAYVPMSMCGFQLYQEPKGGKCWGVDPLYLGIVERTMAEKVAADVMSGDRLVWKRRESSQEAVVLGAVRKAGHTADEWERTIWIALEALDLHRSERPN